MDQARHHAAGPYAGVHVAIEHDARIHARHLGNDVLEFEVLAQRGLFFQQPLGRGIVEHALGVAQRTHHQARVELTCRNQRALDVVVDRRLFGRHEARAHVHAFRAHGERGDQAALIGHPA